MISLGIQYIFHSYFFGIRFVVFFFFTIAGLHRAIPLVSP